MAPHSKGWGTCNGNASDSGLKNSKRILFGFSDFFVRIPGVFISHTRNKHHKTKGSWIAKKKQESSVIVLKNRSHKIKNIAKSSI